MSYFRTLIVGLLAGLLCLDPVLAMAQSWGPGEFGQGIFHGTVTTNITGSTQCVHANTSGVLSGTGADCGSGSGAVSSFNSRTGAIVPTTGDYSIGQITGAGTAAAVNTGTTGAVVPLLTGTNAWSGAQVINLNSATPPASISPKGIVVKGADATVARGELEAFGAIAAMTVSRADGTGASPTQVLSGEEIGGFNAYGYGSGAWNGPLATIHFYAAENIASGHFGSKACIGTTPVATTTIMNGLCQQASGGITIGSPTGGDEGAATLNVPTIYQNGVQLAASATSDTTNASNIVSGFLAAARGGAGGVTGVLKATAGVVSAATAKVDFVPATAGTAIQKADGAGGLASAVLGTDFAPPTSGSSLLAGNGLGGFTTPTGATVAAAAGLSNFVTAEQASGIATIGNGTTDATSTWVGMLSHAGASIYCPPGDVYLISSSLIITVNNVHLYGKCVLKAKVGAGGFNSTEFVTGRYSTVPVIYWDQVDGGGFEYLEVYQSANPGSGGDVSLIPVAVQGGMSTQPFVAGTLYVHDTTGLPSGDLAIDSIGAAGLSIDHIKCVNFGTDYTGWTYSGGAPPYGSISNLCVHVDSDQISNVVSQNLHFGEIKGVNGYLGVDAYALAGEQTSFLLLGGSGTNTNGGTIDTVDYSGQGQGIDIQQSNWLIGKVTCANVMLCYKFGYGASNNKVGPTWVQNSLLEGVLFYGNGNGVSTTQNNIVASLSGNLVAERVQNTGTITSATSTTAVLGSGSAINSEYTNGFIVYISAGTNTGSWCTITGYVGATKTATCSGGWTAGTPNNTSTYKILGSDHRNTVLYCCELMGYVAQNQVTLDVVTNGGLNVGPVYSNLAAGPSTGNRLINNTGTNGTAQTAAGVTLLTPVSTLATVAVSGLASDLTGTLPAASLPNPTASTKGGVESLVATTHQFINTISTSGVPASAQPACADISNAGTSCTVNTGTSGATIPLLNGANTWSGVQSINSGDLGLKGATSGTLTVNAAATAGSNTLTLPAGTTDFSGTGGTSQVVKQTSTGGAFTVARLACADLSNAGTSCTVNTGTSGATIPLLNAANTYSAQQGITNTSAGAATVALALTNVGGGSAGTQVSIDLATNGSGVGVRSAQVAAVVVGASGNELHLKPNCDGCSASDGIVLDGLGHVNIPETGFGSLAVSSCGTTPVTATGSNNVRGMITTGTGTVTACTVGFSNTFAAAPHCSVTPHANVTMWFSAISTGAFTANFSTSSPSTAFEFICFG